MPLAVCNRTGSGTRLDPYRPDFTATDETGWSAYTLPTGQFLVDFDGTILDAPGGVVDASLTLADLIPAAVRSRLAAVFDGQGGRGKVRANDFRNMTIGQAIIAMDGDRIEPETDKVTGLKMRRLWMNGKLAYEAPVIEGGAAEVTEPFTYSNGALASVSSGAWVNVKYTDHNVSSNTVPGVSGQDKCARWGTAITSADHYAQCNVNYTTGAQYAAGGPMTRMNTSTTAVTGYLAQVGSDNFNQKFMLASIVADAYTQIASSARSGNFNGLIYLESEGTSHTVKHAGTTASFSPTTNTAISSSNTRVGIYTYIYNSVTVTLDNFEAGTLGAATPTASGAPTDQRDTASGTATSTAPASTASGTPTDQVDTASGTATSTAPASTASGTPTDQRDTASGTATAAVPASSASGTPTDQVDTATGTATSTAPSSTASGAPTDVRDTSSGVATSTAPASTASGTPTDQVDTASGTATAAVPASTASGTPTDQVDTASGTAAIVGSTPTASGAPTDQVDTASGTATSTAPASTASGAPTDQRDTASGTATATAPASSASGTPTDQVDTAAGTATSVAPVASASGTPTDQVDTAAGTATAATVSSSASGAPTDQRDTATGTALGNIVVPSTVASGAPTDQRDRATGRQSAPPETRGVLPFEFSIRAGDLEGPPVAVAAKQEQRDLELEDYLADEAAVRPTQWDWGVTTVSPDVNGQATIPYGVTFDATPHISCTLQVGTGLQRQAHPHSVGLSSFVVVITQNNVLSTSGSFIIHWEVKTR